MPPMPADHGVRDAATVLILRDAPGGFETLMLRRHGRSGFAADMWVFPGGVVDAADATLPADRWTGLDLASLEQRFDLPGAKVLAFHVAAVRETFEEAGLLLAHHADGASPDLSDPDLLRLRHDLADRDTDVDFVGWLQDQDLVLELGELTYLSHWLTPTVEPRRYDTRFFVARMPADQDAGHDQLEITDQQWIAPGTALDEYSAGRMQLIYPTIKTLQALTDHATVDDVVAWAAAQRQIRRILPHAVIADGKLVDILHPDHPDYPHELYGQQP
jgi:8-oxo-dGTP pyrophosphatase MutT (NUDIX family)